MGTEFVVFVSHTCKRAPPGTRLHERRCTVWSCFKFTHTRTPGNEPGPKMTQTHIPALTVWRKGIKTICISHPADFRRLLPPSPASVRVRRRY